MKVSQAVDFHVQYQIPSKLVSPHPIRCQVRSTRSRQHLPRGGPGVPAFADEGQQASHEAESLLSHSVQASFYNFSINTGLPALTNPCNTSVIQNIFKRLKDIQWNIVDKEAIDEIIFRTKIRPSPVFLIEVLMEYASLRYGNVNLMISLIYPVNDVVGRNFLL